MRKFLTVLALGFILQAASLTLQQAIQYALTHNPSFLAEKERVEAAKAQKDKAMSGFLPKISFQGQRILQEKLFTIEIPPFFPGDRPKKVKMDFTRNYQLGLSINQVLFTGGKVSNAYRSAKFNYEASKRELEEKKLELIYNVKRAYFSALLAKQVLSIAEEALKLAERHYKQVKALYEVGNASKFELLSAEVNYENAKPDVLKARNSYRLALLNLKNILGMPSDFPVELADELKVVDFDLELDEVIKLAYSSSPTLKRIAYQKKAAQALLGLSKASFSPDILLSMSYNWRFDQFSLKPSEWENYYTVSLIVSIPIFSGFSRVADLKISSSTCSALNYTEKAVKDLLALRVRSAYYSLLQAKQRYEAALHTLRQARESVRLAELNYRESLITSLQVQQAQLALSKARLNLSQALFDYNMALAELERVVGKNLSGRKR